VVDTGQTKLQASSFALEQGQLAHQGDHQALESFLVAGRQHELWQHFYRQFVEKVAVTGHPQGNIWNPDQRRRGLRLCLVRWRLRFSLFKRLTLWRPLQGFKPQLEKGSRKFPRT
jgi:hypothetical protein